MIWIRCVARAVRATHLQEGFTLEAFSTGLRIRPRRHIKSAPDHEKHETTRKTTKARPFRVFRSFRAFRGPSARPPSRHPDRRIVIRHEQWQAEVPQLPWRARREPAPLPIV